MEKSALGERPVRGRARGERAKDDQRQHHHKAHERHGQSVLLADVQAKQWGQHNGEHDRRRAADDAHDAEEIVLRHKKANDGRNTNLQRAENHSFEVEALGHVYESAGYSSLYHAPIDHL